MCIENSAAEKPTSDKCSKRVLVGVPITYTLSLDPVHTRADPYGSDPKLVRIDLPCTLAPTYGLSVLHPPPSSILRYSYQRGTDKKNGAVWLRFIWLPCEPTDRIQKKVQIGNEANFVYKRGPKHFFCILVHGFVECRRQICIYPSLDPLGSAPVCTH